MKILFYFLFFIYLLITIVITNMSKLLSSSSASTSSLLPKSTTNLASWKDYVQAIEREKKITPNFDYSEYRSRTSTYDRKMKERELNPVRMQYVDNQKEEAFQNIQNQLHQTKQINTLNEKASKFDIIGHNQPVLSEIETQTMRPTHKYKQKTRSYHILSNLDHNDHGSAPIQIDDAYITRSSSSSSSSSPSIPTVQKPKYNQRDLNIIINQFKTNHDEIITREYNDVKEHTLKKYWETHDYDFIRGKYYNPEKEKIFREKREISNQTHGHDQINKLPPSFKKSDGISYNILNNTIKDESSFETLNLLQTRALNRIKKTKDVEATVRQSDELSSSLQDSRKLNRISYRRWEKELTRGYDIITTNSNSNNNNNDNDISNTARVINSSERVKLPQVLKHFSEWDRLASTGKSNAFREIFKENDTRPKELLFKKNKNPTTTDNFSKNIRLEIPSLDLSCR